MDKNKNKIIRKTYAARGLLDFRMVINVTGAVLRLCFSGGYMGTNGVVPAKYTTENEALQKIIENTRNFKSGRVYVSRKEVIELPQPPHSLNCNKDQQDGDNDIETIDGDDCDSPWGGSAPRL